MSDFANYLHAQADKRAAYECYNHAGIALEMACIKERLAEIKSQHNPLTRLSLQPLTERDKLYAAAFYVVIGRMPDNMPNNKEIKS